VDLAQLLIECGANIEEINNDIRTPLMQAALEYNEEIVTLLLIEDANVQNNYK